MPTAFGNYTRAEYQAAMKRIADQKRAAERAARMIVRSCVQLGKSGAGVLSLRQAVAILGYDWEKLAVEEARSLRASGYEPQGPYAGL